LEQVAYRMPDEDQVSTGHFTVLCKIHL